MTGDFAMLPLALICDRELGHLDLRVYAFHACAMDRRTSESRWSQTEIAIHLGVVRETVGRAEKRLEARGHVRLISSGSLRVVRILETPGMRLAELRDAGRRVTQGSAPVTEGSRDVIDGSGRVTDGSHTDSGCVIEESHERDRRITETPASQRLVDHTSVTLASAECDRRVAVVRLADHTYQIEQEPERAETLIADARAHEPAPASPPRFVRPAGESPVSLVGSRWNLAAERHPVLQQHLAGAQHQILAMWEEFKVGAEQRGCTPIELLDEALCLLTALDPKRIEELRMATLHGAARRSETYAVSKLMALVSGLYGPQRQAGGKRESTTSWRHTKDTHIAPDIDAPQPEGMF